MEAAFASFQSHELASEHLPIKARLPGLLQSVETPWQGERTLHPERALCAIDAYHLCYVEAKSTLYLRKCSRTTSVKVWCVRLAGNNVHDCKTGLGRSARGAGVIFVQGSTGATQRAPGEAMQPITLFYRTAMRTTI